jgi:5-methylthioribose kinase
MQEVTPENAVSYLRETRRVPPGVPVTVRELRGGVSNVVLRVDIAGQPPIVLKQSRPRLRVAMEWLSPLERIWTEVAALRVLAGILPAGSVPEVLFEDRANHLFAMSCAPDDAIVWKSLLMEGRIDPQVADWAGRTLGAVHAETDAKPGRAGAGTARLPALDVPPLCDSSLFDSLRIDPYYRTTARAHPDLAPVLGDLIASMSAERTLVLGDFSPKNILVHGHGLILLDFETAHAGDPAFDLGFFLSHLVLKTFRARRLGRGPAGYLGLIDRFWRAYTERAGIDPAGSRSRRGARHTLACVLARLDGKSPVDYRDELDQGAVRSFARTGLAAGEPPDCSALGEHLAREVL